MGGGQLFSAFEPKKTLRGKKQRGVSDSKKEGRRIRGKQNAGSGLCTPGVRKVREGKKYSVDDRKDTGFKTSLYKRQNNVRPQFDRYSLERRKRSRSREEGESSKKSERVGNNLLDERGAEDFPGKPDGR